MAIQKYGSKVRLMNNQRYLVSFNLKGEKKDFAFTSRYTPMHSTLRIIRNDFPDQFDEVTDDTINFALWQNSLMVEEIMEMAGLDSENLESTIVFARKQYVRYKTEYDILRSIVVAQASVAGASSKKLGEFEISSSSRLEDPNLILNTLKGEISKWESALGTGPRIAGAVRAKRGFPYPIEGRMSF